jgi:hypothetical protein
MCIHVPYIHIVILLPLTLGARGFQVFKGLETEHPSYWGFYLPRDTVLGNNRLNQTCLKHSGGARSRNLGANSYLGGGKIEFLKRYCYTATGGRIS